MNELENIIAELKKNLADAKAAELLHRKNSAQATAKAKEFEALYIREHEQKHKIDADWQLKHERISTEAYILEEFIEEKNLQSEYEKFKKNHPDSFLVSK